MFDGTVAHSPIVTNDAPATRPADKLLKTGMLEHINPDFFTILGQHEFSDQVLDNWIGIFKLTSAADPFGEGIALQFKNNEARALYGDLPSRAFFSLLLPESVETRLRWGISLDKLRKILIISANGVCSDEIDISSLESPDIFQLILSIYSGIGGTSGGHDALKQISYFNIIPYLITKTQLEELTAL